MVERGFGPYGAGTHPSIENSRHRILHKVPIGAGSARQIERARRRFVAVTAIEDLELFARAFEMLLAQADLSSTASARVTGAASALRARGM